MVETQAFTFRRFIDTIMVIIINFIGFFFACGYNDRKGDVDYCRTDSVYVERAWRVTGHGKDSRTQSCTTQNILKMRH